MRHCLLSLTTTVASCLCAGVTRADEVGLDRVKIDGEVTIYSPGSEIGHTMPQVRRHPDGSIYVNGCRSGLFKSTDNGKSWTRIPWPFDPNGFGISRDGRLWLVDRKGSTASSVILVIQSADGGRTWKKQELDCGPLAPGGAADPYKRATPHGAYTNFVERPDGTLMFSVGMRYEDWGNFNNKDQSRPGIRDVMVRTTDGGKTWGDPTIVHQHATETDFAVDPSNANHILAFTRIQRGLLPGEDPTKTGCSFGWSYKNGLLLESTDGGRTFRELPGGMTECYGHRGSILWAKNNVIVVTRNRGCKTIEERRARGRSGAAIEAQISLNGGRTWVADNEQGTPHLNQAKRFTLVPFRKAHSFTSPTVELSKNHFLTVFVTGADTEKTTSIKGVLWHIDTVDSRCGKDVAPAKGLPAQTPRPKPTGFGCYAYMHKLGGMSNWRKHVRLMKAHGMNTFAIFTRGPQDIAAQIDIAIEEGMLEKQVPMFLLDHSGPDLFKQLVPNWEEVVKKDRNPPPGWTAGFEVGAAAVIAQARKIAKYPDKWPELIPYSVDEPGRGKPMSDKDVSELRKLTARYNSVGYRCGTACIYPNVKNLVPALDVISVASIYGGDLKGCKQAIEAGKKEFWVYNTGIPKMNPTLVRWTMGYWTWQVQARSHLAWDWNGFIQGEMSDPQPTKTLLAYAKGVGDFKLFSAAESRLKRLPDSGKSQRFREVHSRLQALRAGFHWENLPPKEFAAVRAKKKPWYETVPKLDLNELKGMAEPVIK